MVNIWQTALILMAIYIDSCHNKRVAHLERPPWMTLRLRVTAELLGTAVLVAAVVGSGIMADRLTDDFGVALLVNLVATVFALGVLIATLLPVSGAHFNPAVTLSLMLRGETSPMQGLLYVAAQLSGGVLGTLLAHAMFDRPLLDLSENVRITPGTFLGEVVATVGLIALILTALYQRRTSWLPVLVPAWIGAGYLFTSSTSFANPAVTLARVLTDSFSGVDPVSAAWFVLAQLIGATLALALVHPFRVAYAKEHPHE